MVVKYFLKIGIKGKFDSMKDLATLLAYIKEMYPFTIIKVTDHLVEQVFCQIVFYDDNLSN